MYWTAPKPLLRGYSLSQFTPIPKLTAVKYKYTLACVVELTFSQMRGSVSCGSGWSVPCVSIQLTLSQMRTRYCMSRSVLTFSPQMLSEKSAQVAEHPASHDVAAGTVLCSYPGTVFRPEDLPLMHQMVLPGNSYVVARRDGVLLDGRPDGPSLQIREMARERDAAKRRATSAAAQSECVFNFAIGHRINHPPAGLLPNAIIFPFDLHEGEHTCLHPLLDVFHFRPPAKGDPIKQSAVFIATRPLRDEELFLDYKLNMQGPLEAWYSRVVYPTCSAAHRDVNLI